MIEAAKEPISSPVSVKKTWKRGASLPGQRGFQKTHGMTGTPEYNAWKQMKGRCLNPDLPNYKDYGGRGIKVCDKWLNFDAFLRDVGMRPSDQHSIGRIDNNGDYTPENCRWETVAQQQGNKRNNSKITCFGLTRTISEWAQISGISKQAIRYRLQAGWRLIDCFSPTVL